MNARRTFRPAGGQRGFTLIVVLVSSLVLGIGLVGVAGLQALALKNNQSAFMRSQATAMAYDLADRMRSNVSGAQGGFYDPSNAALNDACVTPAGCSPAEIAAHDLAEWREAVSDYLPLGEGIVCVDSTPEDGTGFDNPQCDGTGTGYSIKIWWDDNRDGEISVAAGDMERFSAIVQL
jgi:type IV pilus assembly protein PilV